MSDDVSETVALTPGHLLIGKAILNPPDPVTMDIETNVTNRWKLVNKVRRDFWNAWSTEYLSRLQQRNKWKIRQENVKVGDLVLLKEEINPSQWPLARITEVYPAKDGAVRVASIKQANGSILKRPITKIVPLPTMQAAEDKNGDSTVTINTNASLVEQHKEMQDHKKRKPKERAIGIGYLVWLLLLLASCVNTLGQSTYTIKYPEPGFYVEHIGFAKIERGTFRIEVRFPKERLKEDEEMVNKTVSKFQEFCDEMKKLTDLSQCKTLTHHIVEQQEQLRWTIQSMTGIISRERRGLLGNLLTSIFGVNDEVYKDIDELEANQDEFIKASNHQTKFLVSALASVNDTEIRVARQLNHFRDKLNQGLEAINTMQKWYRAIDENALNIHMLNTYQVVNNYIQEVQQQYAKLLTVHVKEGHLYEFVTPVHVTNIITAANRKLPSGIAVLAHPILKTKVQHSEENICIYGYFMLVEIADYTVIKPTPVPLKVENGSYWTLEIPSEVLAIDYNSQTYFELSKEEFERSIFLPKNRLLCSPAVVRSIENSPNCIIDEIYQRIERTRCHTRKKTIRSINWKQLYMTNTWMFVTNEPTRIAIICNGQREDVTLNITGIIQISQNCVLKTKQSTLTAKMLNTVPVIAGFNKPVAVKINDSIHDKMEYQEIAKEPVFQVSDQLGSAINNEKQLQQELEEWVWKKVRHHSTTISSTIIGVTLIGGILVWSMYQWLTRKCSTTGSPSSDERERQPMHCFPRTIESIEMQPIYSEIVQPPIPGSSATNSGAPICSSEK